MKKKERGEKERKRCCSVTQEVKRGRKETG